MLKYKILLSWLYCEWLEANTIFGYINKWDPSLQGMKEWLCVLHIVVWKDITLTSVLKDDSNHYKVIYWVMSLLNFEVLIIWIGGFLVRPLTRISQSQLHHSDQWL